MPASLTTMTPQLATVLLNAERKIRLNPGTAYDAYSLALTTLLQLSNVDAFWIAFLKGDTLLAFPYAWDTKYEDPDTMQYTSDGVCSHVIQRRAPYLYSQDGGALLKRRSRRFGQIDRAAEDAIVIPMIDTSSSVPTVLGVASIQSYTAQVYGPVDLTLLERLAASILVWHKRHQEDAVWLAALESAEDPTRQADPLLALAENYVADLAEVRSSLMQLHANEFATREEIRECLCQLVQRCERTATELMEYALWQTDSVTRAWSLLSQREKEVARLITLDMSNQEICHQLSIATGTAKKHVNRILKVFGARQRSAVAELLRHRRLT